MLIYESNLHKSKMAAIFFKTRFMVLVEVLSCNCYNMHNYLNIHTKSQIISAQVVLQIYGKFQTSDQHHNKDMMV